MGSSGKVESFKDLVLPNLQSQLGMLVGKYTSFCAFICPVNYDLLRTGVDENRELGFELRVNFRFIGSSNVRRGNV